MTSVSGLSVQKPVSSWNQLFKVNFKDLFKALAKAGLDVTTQNWVAVGKDVVDAATAVGLKSESPAELAWTLIYASMIRAIVALVGESQYLMTVVPSDINQIVERLDFSFEGRELEISERFFEHPEQLSLVKDMQLPLSQWFEGVGMSVAQAEALSNRLPTYFVFELEKEWRQHPIEYERITAQVKTPFTQANERTRGWRLYEAWLEKQIQAPMMLEAFGLENVYVPLRGYYRKKRQVADGDEGSGLAEPRGKGATYERVVVDLEAALNEWLCAAKKNDAIRVISGGPGSGKSSFAKIFAAHHARQGLCPVLFVPLHQFDPTGDLIKAIGEFIRYEEYINDNPLNPEDDGLRLLLIFDGLDELAMQGKLSKEVAQGFVREVQAKVSQFNRSQTRLQVVFTGREVVVQESFSRDPSQILHVLPYFVPEDKRKQEYSELYLDPSNLLAKDQRDEWWQRYGAATRSGETTMPEGLARDNLAEITAQPLLNYLVALSHVQGHLTLSETTNLNTIYADLLDAVYERGYEDNRRHAAIGDMSKEQFIRILEEIALAAWHGDGRTTTIKEIADHCESSGLKRLLDVFEEGAQAGVTRLLAAFYFRQSGERSSERTFEFTHKSFGEYLTARRIVRLMVRIQQKLAHRQEDMEEGWDELEALLQWAKVCGPTRMDVYLLNFLRDEVVLREPALVAKLQIAFGNLIGVMLRQGMPMEDIKPPLKYHRANQWAIHAEEALLVALNASALVTETPSVVDWYSSESCGAWIRRLQGQRTGAKNSVALLSLALLKLPNTALYFLDLYGAHLEGANLVGANLSGANLGRANLERANCEGANLERANLERAHLEGAHLERANLEGAHLSGAYLERAHLEGAHLERAHLERADLRRANLEGAYLERANLRRANLEGTILERTSSD